MSKSYGDIEVTTRAEWRAWLEANHGSSPGIWLITWKKAAGADRYLPYGEIVEEALCFGWVDSLPRRVDELRSGRLITPRKPKAGWSAANKERIERLTAAGLMAPAGIAAVEVARANGAWAEYDHVNDGIEPDDLRAALDAVPEARREWDGFPPSFRKGVLAWVGQAKRPETRAKRIAAAVSEAAEGRRVNEWIPPSKR